MPVKKTTILAADDDPQLLRLVTRNLQFEGCEDVCRRGEFDAPIAIRDLKRFAMDLRDSIWSMSPCATC